MPSLSAEKTLVSKCGQGAVWNVRPFQLVSLLDMIKFLPLDLYVAIGYLNGMEQHASEQKSVMIKPMMLEPLKEDDQKHYQFVINKIRKHCEQLELESALDQIARIDQSILLGSAFGTYKMLSDEVRQLKKCIETDLSKRLFMFMPPAEAKYYKQEELFSAEVKAKFPEANKEITEAGNCYATGNYTACVFHLMRAVEYGVRVVFKRLRIKFPVNPKRPNDNRPVEERQWGEINGAIDKEIERLEKRKKTPARDKKIEFLRGFNIQFKYYKIKWRNNVMHTKESYEEPDAKATMRHVGDFMEHLAERLKE